jgi:S-layer protein (TIGR01567 family)
MDVRKMSPKSPISRNGINSLSRILDGFAKESYIEKIRKVLGLDSTQKSVIVYLLLLAVLVVIVTVTMTQWSNLTQWSSNLTQWNNNNPQEEVTNQTEEHQRNYPNSMGLNNLIINGPTLTISNKDAISLTNDSSVKIGQGMYFKVADNDANVMKFYVCKEIAESEAHEIRGQNATGNVDFTWTADNFAGFTYDVKKNVSTESLKVSKLDDGKTIPKNGLIYTTTIKTINYESNNFSGSYPILGFFGEAYVPLKSNDASKLAKLILDNNALYTRLSGQTQDLGQGYSLKVKKVDVEGKKIWLEFDKDGQKVDEQTVSTDTGSDRTWTCKVDKIQGEDGIPVLKVHVYRIFHNKPRDIAQIDGLWLIDLKNASIVSREMF